MKKILIFLMGLLLLYILGYTCVNNKADLIQYQLSKQIKDKLSTSDFKDVVLEVDGRNVSLKGEIATAQLKQQAESLAKINGVLHLSNVIKVVTPPKLLSKTLLHKAN